MSSALHGDHVPGSSGYVLTPDGTPYLYFRFPVEFSIGMATIFLLVGVGLLGSLAVRGGPPIAWLIGVGMAGAAAVWLWGSCRAEYELVVAHAQLTWRSLRRSGSCPIASVVRVRPSANGASAALTLDTGRILRVPVTSDFLPFARGLADAYPRLDVWTSGYSGFKLTWSLLLGGGGGSEPEKPRSRGTPIRGGGP